MKSINAENGVVDNLKRTQVREKGDGSLGLFCVDRIKDGFILGFLDGQIVDKESDIVEDSSNRDLEWNVLNENSVLVRPFKTKYSYICHSQDKANIALEANPLRVVCIKDIEPGEEILLNFDEISLSTLPESSHPAYSKH